MRAPRSGFTLLEVVIALGLTSIVFAIASQTLFSCTRIASSVAAAASEAESRLRFFASFRETVGLMLREKDDVEASADTLRIVIRRPGSPEPVRLTLGVRADESGASVVWQKEEALFSGHTVAFPAWRTDEEVSFAYLDGEEWTDAWDKEDLPDAIAVKMRTELSSFLFPVRIRP